MKGYRGIYRDENAVELNKMLENLYEDVGSRLCLIEDGISNITECGLKELEEVFNTPEDCMRLIMLREIQTELSSIHKAIESILYSEFEVITGGSSVEHETKTRKTPVRIDWKREDIDEICIRVAKGETFSSNAERYNVEDSTISHLLKRNGIADKKEAKEYGQKLLQLYRDLQ